jgi:hypothetical protein
MPKPRTNTNSCPLNFPGETLAPDWRKQHKAILKSGRIDTIIEICRLAEMHHSGWDDTHAAIALCGVYEELVKCMYEYEYHGS